MKTAVILFNLGGPDGPEAVRPFLFNMFRDRAILRMPNPFRFLLAWLISSRRAPIAREIYNKLGGGSPIVTETRVQAEALQARLGKNARVFIAMRYWHPRVAEVARAVQEYAPERVILLPLYPQFSTATTASSFEEWRKAFPGVSAAICCYPVQEDFIAAHVDLIRTHYQPGMRILFSAHGLPEKIIRAGDPYQWQVEQTVAAIVSALAMDSLDHAICYQSRVGRLVWVGPSTDDEIRRAGAEARALLVVPVAFVSEHSETLVELDIEYAHLAKVCGVPEYVRVPALGTHSRFIDALERLCRGVEKGCGPLEGGRLCPTSFTQCGCINA